ncbi:MAG: NAD(P)-dependent oxidoreductase [Nitrospirae bacterium]|nr:NAD(P)-dependent oxidoreductase [Nitrospirota bacterium]
MRIAVLGANGQVGAELCLLLARQEKIDVVPVCRSRMGSAFLRSQGMACRHGDVVDAGQVPGLIGDCDIVANLALVGLEQNYRESMAIHDRLIRHVGQFGKQEGIHIYFSTMSVYGDAQVNQRIVFRNLYGREKYRCENVARTAGAKYGRETFIFRLGHVCGELQGITREIRQRIAQGPIPVPDLERASNTVYVASILDAILKVAAGTVAPGTYDLMNRPQWTWKEVFEYEGRVLGITPTFTACEESTGTTVKDLFSRSARQGLMAAASNPLARKAGSRLMALLPSEWHSRLKARYSTRAAGAEIGKLSLKQEPMEAVLRRPVGSSFLDVLTATADLLGQPEFHLPDHDRAVAWPPDLPLFEERSPAYALPRNEVQEREVTHA